MRRLVVASSSRRRRKLRTRAWSRSILWSACRRCNRISAVDSGTIVFPGCPDCSAQGRYDIMQYTVTRHTRVRVDTLYTHADITLRFRNCSQFVFVAIIINIVIIGVRASLRAVRVISRRRNENIKRRLRAVFCRFCVRLRTIISLCSRSNN